MIATAVQQYQYLPQMGEKDYERLRESIERSGGLWPGHEIEVDENGLILDGYHREKACAELGLPCPRRVRTDLRTEDEKFDYIWSINMARRHLSIDQKRDMVREYLRRFPDRSNRQIAETAGISHPTVGGVRAELEAAGEIDQVTRPHQRPDQASGKIYQTDDDIDQPEATYAPEHQGHVVVRIIVPYTVAPQHNPNPTERARGGLPHAREEVKWWKGEVTMQEPIPVDAISLYAFAQELARKFEKAVRDNPFVTMRTDT